MYAFACFPAGDPDRTDALNMSPVEICGTT
jgi:hypothetical protein